MMKLPCSICGGNPRKGNSRAKVSHKKLLNAADTGIEDLEILGIAGCKIKKSNHIKTQEVINENSNIQKGLFFSKLSIYTMKMEKVFDKILVPFGKWESQGTTKLS